MSSITDFYYNRYLPLPWDYRQQPLIEVDDVVIVNFAIMFDRNYSFRGTDQLIYFLHKLGPGKRFMFMFDDGTNPFLSGGTEIIKNIVDEFKLTTDTCLVWTRDELDLPNVSIIKEDAVELWVRVLHPVIKDIPIYPAPFSKKFAVWFHRGTFYRLQIARQLYTKYRDDSYISYQEYGMLHDITWTEQFIDDITWANANTPIVYDQLFPKREYTHDMIVGGGRKPYHDYFMEIVVETDCLNHNWITEKTVKNLYIGKPFIMMGGAFSLAHIHRQGFKTFSPWIDESYDSITNVYQRFEAIKQEIDRLAAMPIEQLNQMHQEMMPIFEYNRRLYNVINSR